MELQPDSTRIYFYYPSKIIGGCELLMVRLCRLVSGMGYKASILCEDGDIYWSAEISQGVRIDRNLDLESIGQVVAFITPISECGALLKKARSISDSSRVIFAITHPHLLTKFLPIVSRCASALGLPPSWTHRYLLPLDFRIARRLLLLSNRRRAAFFVIPQFREAYQASFGVFLSGWRYLPLPISSAAVGTARRRTSGVNRICQATYIGRLEGAQTAIIQYLLDEFALVKDKCNVRLALVGSGADYSLIREHAKERGFLDGQLVFRGRLTPDELARTIESESDLCFGTGTSAIESAIRRVPTCVLDSSFKFIKNYRFRWAHEASPYPLGCLLEDYPTYSGGRHTFAGLIESVNHNHVDLSEACYRWAAENFPVTRTADELKGILLDGGVTLRELRSTGILRAQIKHEIWGRAMGFIRNFRSLLPWR